MFRWRKRATSRVGTQASLPLREGLAQAEPDLTATEDRDVAAFGGEDDLVEVFAESEIYGESGEHGLGEYEDPDLHDITLDPDGQPFAVAPADDMARGDDPAIWAPIEDDPVFGEDELPDAPTQVVADEPFAFVPVEPPADATTPAWSESGIGDAGSTSPDSFTSDQGDQVPGNASPIMSGASLPDVAPAAVKTVHQKKKRSRVLPFVATTLVSVVGAAGLVVGCGAIGHAYFEGHAKPGTQLAGQDITGFSETQVEALAMTLMEGYQAKLQLGTREVVASPEDLGIDFDLDQTVANAMSAGAGSSATVMYSPFEPKDVPFVVDIDQDRLQDFLNDRFIVDNDRSVPADVKWDGEQQKFIIVPSILGHQADAKAVADMLGEGEGYLNVLEVPTIAEEPVISDETAQESADAANAFAGTPYVVRAADQAYQIPGPVIASWMVLDQDVDAGEITWTIDAAKVSAEVPAMVETSLTQAPVPTQYLIGPEGNTLGLQSEGSDGTMVADPAGVAASVVAALGAGKGMDLTVAVTVEPHAVENVPMAPEYLVENGARWVEVNRSNYTVTRWEGTTKLSVWSVVIGRPATPTYAGIFHVWYMNPLQDMSGDDYLQPNVPWNAYFNNDIALHGNYWSGGFGWASSHGCVGMPVGLAEVMYHWINIGDLVVVHD